MNPAFRKWALTAHVTVSVGWLGAASAYFALAVSALVSEDPRLVRSAYFVMEPLARWGIVPLAVASLLTGLVSALGTPWGLFRHYWIVAKLALTLVATAILLGNMRTLALLAEMAAKTADPDPAGLTGQILHSGGGVVVLLLASVLGMFKPKGLTRYGWRKQSSQTSV